jgi:hypothetical protein
LRIYNDKQNRERADIIRELDPLPNKTLEDSVMILENGGISKINFIIKSRLINFVNRFERENTDVVKFGSMTNFNRKIEQINEEFKKYAEEENVEPKIEKNEIV